LPPKEKHKFNTGDYVVFEGVEGMTELNGKRYKVKCDDPFKFKIDCDTREYNSYTG